MGSAATALHVPLSSVGHAPYHLSASKYGSEHAQHSFRHSRSKNKTSVSPASCLMSPSHALKRRNVTTTRKPFEVNPCFFPDSLKQRQWLSRARQITMYCLDNILYSSYSPQIHGEPFCALRQYFFRMCFLLNSRS